MQSANCYWILEWERLCISKAGSAETESARGFGTYCVMSMGSINMEDTLGRVSISLTASMYISKNRWEVGTLRVQCCLTSNQVSSIQPERVHMAGCSNQITTLPVIRVRTKTGALAITTKELSSSTM